MTDEENLPAETDDELFKRKRDALVERGARSAVKKRFTATDLAGFGEALKKNPNMTWLEYFATLIPKK